MKRMLNPVVGRWYLDVETDTLFEVVAWEPRGLAVEVQYVDGEVAEFDLEVWSQLALEPAAAPEDWRNPFELDDEDSADPDLPYHPEDWNNPVSTIEPDAMLGVEEY